MKRYLHIICVLAFSAAPLLRADVLTALGEKKKIISREIHQLNRLLNTTPHSAKRVYRHNGKTYTVLGKDSSGLFCKVYPGKTTLLKWNALPSNILVDYRTELARTRLTALQERLKKLDQEYVFAKQQIRLGRVFSNGKWVTNNNQSAGAKAEGTVVASSSNEFSVFNVRFGMTPLEVLAVWPEAKPATTSDGFTTLEYRNKTQNILLSSFFSEEQRVIMIMVAFEDLTTTKRNSIIETLDEKYTRSGTEEDKDDQYTGTYVYYPEESIILVAKTRRTDMGHIAVCTYGHIDKYKENEEQQKEIMKEALKTLL